MFPTSKELHMTNAPGIMGQLHSINTGNYFGIAIWIAILVGIAVLVNWLAKKVLLRFIHQFVDQSRNKWDDALVQHKVFLRLSHLAPAVIIYHLSGWVFAGHIQLLHVCRTASLVYMILTGVWVIDSLLNAVITIYRSYELNRRVPIRGFIQVLKVFLYAYALITVLSLLLDRSPNRLLAGMGALTAVLMLVFKDAILGLVAGVQLTTNNMLRVGDWIEMPKYGADGDVTEITLTTVKVQNWDKNIISIPTYALITDAFKNWRGMKESGGRRIKRCVYIDMNSIRFCDDAMLENYGRINCLRDYLAGKRKELADYNAEHHLDPTVPVNARRLTNIGTFRAYLVEYLRRHPKVHQNLTLMVRQLEPTSHGLPIQIYVFSSDQVWINYEAIQSDIFDHILAVAPEFGLRVYQNPTGSDFQQLAPQAGQV